MSPLRSYPYRRLPADRFPSYEVSRHIPLELSSPPAILTPPSLPSPVRDTHFSNLFSVTTHIFPAAFPRTHPHIPLPELPTKSADKEAYNKALKQIRKKLVKGRIDYQAGLLDDLGHSSQALWCSVNRYSRRRVGGESERGPGLTLVLVHAMGFNKETWEPTLSHLVSLFERNSLPSIIDEIWCLEAVQHGDSALLNIGKHSALWDWSDYGRDVMNLLVHYLPEDLSSSPPTHLINVSENIALLRQSIGFSNRTVVGIGHSFGATAILSTAIKYPMLWSSIISIDPIIFPTADQETMNKSLESFIHGSMRRHSSWTSREEAARALRSNPYFASWDLAPFEKFVNYGLYEDPKTGHVHLKTNPIHEGISFESRSAHEMWELLPSLDPRVELFWIMPEGDLKWACQPGTSQYLVWRRPKNSSNIIIPDCGHLIPMEKPKQLAEQILAFLARKYAQGFASSSVSARL